MATPWAAPVATLLISLTEVDVDHVQRAVACVTRQKTAMGRINLDEIESPVRANEFQGFSGRQRIRPHLGERPSSTITKTVPSKKDFISLQNIKTPIDNCESRLPVKITLFSSATWE